MKLSVFDRLLVFLSMIVFFCVGIGLVSVYTLPGLDFATLGYEMDAFFEQSYGLLAVVAIALVLVFVSIKLIITAFSAQQEQGAPASEHEQNLAGAEHGASVLIKSTDHGSIVVSPSVIKELAIRKAKMSDKVKDVTCRVERMEQGSKLYLRLVLMPETKMHDFLVPMQEDIKKYVEEMTGTTITGVEIRIEASEPKHRERVK